MRFSMRNVLTLLAYLSVVFVTLQFASPMCWWIVGTTGFLFVCGLTVFAFFSQGEERLFALGFLICGTVYGIFLAVANNDMPTDVLLKMAHDALQQVSTTNFARLTAWRDFQQIGHLHCTILVGWAGGQLARSIGRGVSSQERWRWTLVLAFVLTLFGAVSLAWWLDRSQLAGELDGLNQVMDLIRADRDRQAIEEATRARDLMRLQLEINRLEADAAANSDRELLKRRLAEVRRGLAAVTGKRAVAIEVSVSKVEKVFCASWTLSFNSVLEFSTSLKEKLNVETEAFNA